VANELLRLQSKELISKIWIQAASHTTVPALRS